MDTQSRALPLNETLSVYNVYTFQRSRRSGWRGTFSEVLNSLNARSLDERTRREVGEQRPAQ